MPRFVCIHGHFYQPPRENPWLESIEAQPSASPYHDWNERITRECYAPNAASRLLDEQRRIRRIVNNYSRISFDFGPTLLSWIAERHPHLLAALREADVASRHRFSGHGSALAQAYNHMILPLANPRDLRTQVIWGVAAFRQAFGREPEGMWLPETAVNLATLEALAEAGLRFTILAPHQAARVRNLRGHVWRDVGGACIDPRHAYLARLPSGRELALFFYDGPASRAIAFEGLLNDGGKFAERLLSLHNQKPGAQLAHVATDGESYGHHHAFGDMALAFCLDRIQQSPAERNEASNEAAQLTNYAEYLERFPPRREAEILENTSWSCAHGIERWRSDCGCNSGAHAGWRQTWRAPLRLAFDHLRDGLAPRYEQAAGELLRDPWAARDAYIQVVLDRSPDNVRSFFAAHSRRPLEEHEVSQALRLLEIQHHAMLMYTSCGWFFDEVSGIETTQVIAYAARAAELADQIFGPAGENWTASLQRDLENVPSNVSEFGDAGHVFTKLIEPARLRPEMVAVEHGVVELLNHAGGGSRLPPAPRGYQAESLHQQLWTAGAARLAAGLVEVRSRITGESQRFAYGLLHRGLHNFSGGVRPAETPPATETWAELFHSGDLAGVTARLQEEFAFRENTLKLLFREHRHAVLQLVLRQELADAATVYQRLYDHHVPLLLFLHETQTPIPEELQLAAEFSLSAALAHELRHPRLDLERIAALRQEAERAGISPDYPHLEPLLRHHLERTAAELRADPENQEWLRRLTAEVELARDFPFRVDLWQTQNEVYEILTPALWESMRERADAGDSGAFAWLEAGRVLGERLDFAEEIGALLR